MAANLEIENSLGTAAQIVKDQSGATSALALSTEAVGIGTTAPAATLHVEGPEEQVRVQGSAPGTDNVAYVSFADSTGTRIGYVGDGSTADSNVFLQSDFGDVVLAIAGRRILTAASSTVIVDPEGPGGIVVGNRNTGSGGFTSLLMDISNATDGFGRLQAIRSSGSAWGDIALNSQGGNVGIGTTT
jgi:hypothetical protein